MEPVPADTRMNMVSVDRTKREGKNDAYSHLSSMQNGPVGGFFDRKSKNPPWVLEQGRDKAT